MLLTGWLIKRHTCPVVKIKYARQKKEFKKKDQRSEGVE